MKFETRIKRRVKQYWIKAIFLNYLKSKEIQKLKQLHKAVNNIDLSKHSDIIQFEHLLSRILNPYIHIPFQHLLTCIITQMKTAK